MSKFIAFLVFLVAAGYLAHEYIRPPAPPPLPPEPPVVVAPRDPGPAFSESEIAKVRQSLQDGDASVRWAAVQLLFSIHDPQVSAEMDHMLANDPDADVRIKVLGLMKGGAEAAKLGGLVRGLRDVDMSVRIASLKALGDIGDPSVVTWVTALLKDPEPEVRIAALQTLGRFQDKRKQEFDELTEKLKRDYEEALRRAAVRQGLSTGDNAGVGQ